MSKKEMIEAAPWARMKSYDADQLRWSDTMYGKEEFMDQVISFMTELEEIGSIAFKAKYAENLK